jgi:phosphomannomutase/phosphoglucomutase
MRWTIETRVPENSFDYFEKTLITPNGFREYDVRWLLGKEINPNGFLVLGKAYGTLLRETLGETNVVVGHDFRMYSQDLSRSFIVGLLSAGMHVVDIGMALSPMLYFAQHRFGFRGGAEITASHNENGWTGIKLANGLSSTLGPEGILQFRKIVESGAFATGRGEYESYDGLFDDYRADLRQRPLARKLKVVLAAGNGAAGRFAPPVLRDLGCEVVELDTEADWYFRKCNPNPEDMKFLHGMSRATVENHADVGFGLDGDGDRLGVVDDQGREVFSDKMGLLVARWICPKTPGRPVVIDVKGTGLYYEDPILKQAGAEIVTWKTGHSYIKAKVAETNAVAGFEKSGHWFFNAPFGRGYDDGVLSAVQALHMLAESSRSLSGMIDALPRTWQSPTLEPQCADDVKYKVVDAVAAQYQGDFQAGARIAGMAIRDIILINGVRFRLEDDSWGLVRASSNRPSLVVVAEARKSRDQLYDIVDHIKARLAATGLTGPYDQDMPPR